MLRYLVSGSKAFFNNALNCNNLYTPHNLCQTLRKLSLNKFVCNIFKIYLYFLKDFFED